VKRELKRRIKQDEFVSGFEQVWQFVQDRRKELQIVGAAALVLAVGAWGFSAWRERRTLEAEQAFASAMEIFQAPVTAELALGTPPPAGTVYASAAEKFGKAGAAFADVAERFASLPVGARALYYAGVARMEAGQTAEAEKALVRVAARREPQALEPALARLALAELYRKSGKVDQAVDAFRQVVDEAQAPVPRDYALLSLAATLEDAKRPAEARAAYERLGQDFPASVYAAEAKRRAEFLQTAASS
jgi:tetratricopeptide (TPR) repeat protein